MAQHLRRIGLTVAGTLLLAAPAPVALAAGAGGVEADPGALAQPPAGGAQYGDVLPVVPGRPLVRLMELTSPTVVVGDNAQLRVHVDRRRAQSVRVRLVAAPGRGRAVTTPVVRIPAGTTVTLRLPRTLARGTWHVRLLALGAPGERPVRSGEATLVITARPKPAPAPVPPPPSGDGTPVTPVPPSLGGTLQTVPGIFPVQGAYGFGGDDARFGAGRTGHIHQGQDITAAEGVPVVAPLAGVLLFNDYQASAAGRYVVLHADNGWDMFFAHCQAGSATVEPGTRVAAGERLCNVGATGDATGPHLHFEIWPNGWRQIKGTSPVDPLPQLKVWAG